MPTIALATVAAARALDEDLAPLAAALRDAGFTVHLADWDDADIHWSGFDAVLLLGEAFTLDRINEGFDHLASGSGLRDCVVFDG